MSLAKRALAAGAIALACAGCGGAAPPVKGPEGPKLHLAPLTDLAQGAGLVWLVDVLPPAFLATPDLATALETAWPKAETQGFAERNGGVDPRALDEVVVATYAQGDSGTTLYLARGPVDRGAIETAFKRRAASVDGRAVDRAGDDGIVRTWGSVGEERQQLALLGANGVALEIGRFGPLRVAELFAEERLKKASPALRVPSLARAAELLRGTAAGDPPARAFALGPFEGETARSLGGLLAATTAIAASARPVTSHERAALAITVVFLGGWGPEAKAAGDRLVAAFDRAAASPLGRLTGVDRPLEPVKVDSQPDALRLTFTLDALALGRGVRAATGAEVREMMSY